MKKSLDVTVVLTNFKDEPLIITDESNTLTVTDEQVAALRTRNDLNKLLNKSHALTLRDAILRYISSGSQMGLNDIEKFYAYDAGQLIAKNDTVELGQSYYDVVKKLCDNGKVTRQGTTEDVFNLEASCQIKKLVDAAKVVEDKAE